jgi:hypothetical protein
MGIAILERCDPLGVGMFRKLMGDGVPVFHLLQRTRSIVAFDAVEQSGRIDDPGVRVLPCSRGLHVPVNAS